MTELFTLLGKKWSIFIMYAIFEWCHTFTTIREHTGNPNTKILSDRLAELVEIGILEKCKNEWSYGLTPLGVSLAKKIIDLWEWWWSSRENSHEHK
jgi:DNA-binding HxlR family transcriptional regulator